MKRVKSYLKIIYFFVFLFFCSSFISASCSLGATPLGMGAEANPDQEVLIIWNFYNLYGDRMTHIIVDKINGPDWEIKYDPPLHEEKYDISGVITSKTENLAIENNSVVLTIPENPPKDIIYIKHPNQEGYIPAKQIKIYIKIPEDAEIWQNYRFTFEAKGDCFSEPGAVIPAIATQLNVDVTPKGEFYEKSVKEEKELSGITGAVIGSNATTSIFIVTTILLAVILLFLLIKKRKNNQ